MKKFKAIISTVLVAATLTSCNGITGNVGETKITWLNHIETTDAYVNDYFKYVIPEAYDQNNAEYDVTSKVYAEGGKEVDNVGNMFLIKEEGEYKIEFKAFDGKKTHTATTVVSAIEKSKYSISDANFIYGLNETIDLNGKVISTQDGEVLYSVTHNEQSVALTANSFTATELGSYVVTAKQARQPEYTFSVEVVDKEIYPYPNGMIADATATEQPISTSLNFNVEGTLPNTSTSVVTFDESVKFDEYSNGSTKIAVDFAEGSNNFDMPIKFKPRFSKPYYQALQTAGYEYMAVRMKVEDVKEVANYGFLFFSNPNGKNITYKTCTQNGVLSADTNSTAFWSGKGYQLSNKGWFEFLIPMADFITEYSEEIQLMKMRTYNPYYGKLNIYIDNIYAVKGFAGEDVFEERTLNDVVAVDEVVGSTQDIDELFMKYTVDGMPVTAPTGDLVLDKEASFSFEFRARNRYGVRKADYTTYTTVNPVIATFDSASDLSKIRVGDSFGIDGSSPWAIMETSYDETYGVKIVEEQQKENGGYYSFDVYVASKPAAYYKFLKANGYN